MDIVTKQDKENERRVLQFVRGQFAGFKNQVFKQNPDPMALFDFNAYRVMGKTEVKVRNIASTDYNYQVLSKAKGDEVKANKEIMDFYIIYAFLKDRVIRVYHLNNLDLAEIDYHYTHARTKQRMVKKVCTVNADDFIAEYPIPIEDIYETNT